MSRPGGFSLPAAGSRTAAGVDADVMDAGDAERRGRAYIAAERDRDNATKTKGDCAMFMFKKKLEMPAAGEALPGRAQPIPTAAKHFVNGRALKGPYPAGLETAMFG